MILCLVWILALPRPGLVDARFLALLVPVVVCAALYRDRYRIRLHWPAGREPEKGG